MVRAAVSSVFLIAILNTSFSDLGHLPATLLRPVGIMQLLSWRFYDQLLTPQGMTILKWTMVLSLSLSTIGYLTPLTTKTSALLVLFYQGLVKKPRTFQPRRDAGCLLLDCSGLLTLWRWLLSRQLAGSARVRNRSLPMGFPSY